MRSEEGVVAFGWLKDVGPSTELYRWFSLEKWREFRRRYFASATNQRRRGAIREAASRGVRIAEHDLDGILADYSSDAVLFVPSGPLKRLDAINPLFEALVSEFQKRASSFRMRQRSVDGDHAYILQDHRNRGQLVRIRYRHVCCKERKNSSPSVRCQDQAEALIVALRAGGGTGAC